MKITEKCQCNGETRTGFHITFNYMRDNSCEILLYRYIRTYYYIYYVSTLYIISGHLSDEGIGGNSGTGPA